jgi:hypothetical protein
MFCHQKQNFFFVSMIKKRRSLFACYCNKVSPCSGCGDVICLLTVTRFFFFFNNSQSKTGKENIASTNVVNWL